MPPLEILTHADLPGVEIYLRTITPEIAGELLEKNAERQRNLNPDVVYRYVEDMSDGNWMFSGAPILFDRHGELIDGQHRLRAIEESETTQVCLIIAGLDPDVMKAVDLGRKRTYSTFLSMNKDRPSAGYQAAIIRACWHWYYAHSYGDKGVSRIPVPSPLVHAVPTVSQLEGCRIDIEDTEGLTFTAVSQHAQRLNKQMPKVTITTWGLIYILLTRFDLDAREGFLHELLVEPKSPAADYPINALRNRLARERGRLSRTHQIHLILRAFNAWREGALIQALSVPTVASWSALAMPPVKEDL